MDSSEFELLEYLLHRLRSGKDQTAWLEFERLIALLFLVLF